MRFMMFIKADRNSEAGVFPSRKLFEEMGKFNEEMVKAGVMLSGEGLHPSSKGARVRFSKDQTKVIKGPFTGDLVAGFWMIQTNSLEEAIEWARRVPNPDGTEGEIEIRQVFESADFPADVFPPELSQREDQLREELQRRAAK